MKKSKDSFRDLWNIIKWTDKYLIGVLEGEERQKGAEILFKELMAENFHNLRKETDIQIQEVQISNEMSPKRDTLINCQKLKTRRQS